MRKMRFRLRLLLSLAMVFIAACQGEHNQAYQPTTRSSQGILATTATPATPARVTVTASNQQGLRLDISLGRLQAGSRRTHGQLFGTIGCPGCGTTSEPGKPRLPVIRRLVEAPPGTRPVAELVDQRETTASLAQLGMRESLLPVQYPVPKIPGAADKIPFVIDQEVYSADAFWPAEPLAVSGPFVVRGRWLYQIEITPVRYNPQRGELKFLRAAELLVSFAGDAQPRSRREEKPSPLFDGWLSENVLNFLPAPVPRGTSTDKYADGMLVIVGDSYSGNANLSAYLEERRAEGLKVEVVPMSTIGTTAAQVRSYIRNQYLAWSAPALTYVLLVGDTPDIPAFQGSAGTEGGQYTDNYYAAVDPDDYSSDLLAPDLLVSRISVNNATELNTYLARADNYIFANFPGDTTWMNKLSFLASCDNSSITEGTHNYVINTHTASLGYTGTFPSDPTAGGDQLYCGNGGVTESVIQTHLGDGRLIVNFSGHGDVTYWADPGFTQSYLDGVLPTDAAPFVISNACLTGSFGASSDCWGEMWLAHSKGAILYWGASNYSYWDEDDILEKRLWDGIFQDGITVLSGITSNAKMQLLAHYGATSSVEYYFEEYNDLGDGSIDLYTAQPFDATAVYPAQIPLGVSEIDFNVSRGGSALAGALVCVRGLGVQQVGWTDAAGNVRLVMNPAPATVGDLDVTITAHNMRRQQGTIQVVPADGPYLVHQGHEITSDGSTPVPPNPGRHVVMPITLHNVGSVDATGISATLSSGSPLVTITNANPVYADIASGADGRSTTHAEFDIAPGAADGEILDFSLDWTAAGSYSGTTSFSVTVERPVLLYESHVVSDADSGCDTDGIADAGEAATFSVTIRNQGSGNASGVAATLAAADCGISGPVNAGDIAAGAAAVVDFTVTPSAGIACPAEDWPFTLSVTAAELPQPDVSGFNETLNADITGFTYSDDMEGTPPNGWSHSAGSGSDDWAYATSSSHSPSHAWFCSDPGELTDKYLETPSFSIGDTATMSFWQKMDSETGFDGGVIEISVNGGAWQDLGDYITQNGYNDTISSSYGSPIAGRPAWSGTIDWQQVTVDLSSFGPADIVVRFRFAADISMSGDGWWIDDFNIDAETLGCHQQSCNQPPVVDAGPDQDVQSGDLVQLSATASDPEGQPLQVTWSQTAGPAVTLSDANILDPTFTAPSVSGSAVLTFELAASDGTGTSSDTVNVTVWNCDDNEPCTTDSFTGSGCNHDQLADCSLCGTDGVCLNGVCQAGGQNTEVICDDGDACTQTDICQGGACVGTDPVVCQPLDQCHDAGSCNPSNGACSNPVKPDDSACDDGDACTQTDTCQAGVCTGSDPVTCTAPDQCHGAACNSQTGACEYPALDDGTACNDGDACTQTDTCQAGVCTGSDPVTCTAPDQCHGAACNSQTGTCEYPALEDGTACDDGDACTQTDTCQGGSCVGGNPVVCQPLDSCHQAGVCDPASGECSNPPLADGSACDDGNACTQTDTCQAGVCTGSNPVTCQPLDQCHGAGTCDPQSGECSNPPLEDGTACDDGDACTRTDTCQAGVCTGSDPITCTAPDQCHGAACNAQTGECEYPLLDDGTACDDGDACTRTDTCQAGVCTGSDPVTCQPLDQCHGAGECDPQSGECSNPPLADGSACDDGDACTRSDTCQAGVCTGADPVVCQAPDECHQAGSCDPLTGSCLSQPLPDGTACSDGTCQDGVCTSAAGGCGCSSPGKPVSSWWLVLLGALLLRRRRKK